MSLRGLSLGAGALVLIVVGAMIGFWLYAHLIIGLTLTDQPGMVLFPQSTNANAMAQNKIKIHMNGIIDATVPFKQVLSLPLHGHYKTIASFDTSVPVEFTIVYKGVIPVNSIATIHGITDFNYEKVKRLRNVPFSAQIPLHFEQPVTLTVPVKANLHLVYHGPLGMFVNQTVSAPVDTVLRPHLRVNQDITTPILARFGLKVYWPRTPVPVIIKRADLHLQLDTLRLERAQNHDQAPAVAGASPAGEHQP
ncbi:MAG: hypothetical protein ACRESS_01460 [Stenotrophobium sp.]